MFFYPLAFVSCQILAVYSVLNEGIAFVNLPLQSKTRCTCTRTQRGVCGLICDQEDTPLSQVTMTIFLIRRVQVESARVTNKSMCEA